VLGDRRRDRPYAARALDARQHDTSGRRRRGRRYQHSLPRVVRVRRIVRVKRHGWAKWDEPEIRRQCERADRCIER